MRARITPTVLFRVAAVLTLLYGLAHSSGYPWTPAIAPREAALLENMRALRFEAEGASRTYWEFYLGFGLIISAFLFVQGCALWFCGSLSKEGNRTRPLAAVFALGFAVNAALSQMFFFAAPVVLAVAIAIVLGASFVLGEREEAKAA